MRDELPNQAAVSAEICQQLAAFLRSRGASVVLAYRALGSEVDISALSSEFCLLAPRAHFRPTPHLTLHAWETATELSHFGALQPPLGTLEVECSAVDTVLLPALAYDACGVRLGYGGGFYDRLLANWAVITVGVVDQRLLVPALPHHAHDVPVKWLATQLGVRPTQTRPT